MTALVTGGGGFIGSHLVDALGPETFVVDPVPYPHVFNSRLTVQATQRNGMLLNGVDVIYHLASPVGPVGVLGWAGRLVSEVIETTAIVRDWAWRYNCPLIYVSTSEIYGANGYDHIPEDANRVIASGHTARMEYAVAKLAAETMLLNTPDLDVRIVRPFNVAGPRQKPDGGFVLPRFIAQAKAGKPLTVYTPGTQKRAFTHVLDIVDGILRVARNAEPKTVWNLGNPDNECTIRDLAAEVIELLSSDSKINVIDPKTLWGDAFAEAPDKVPDIERAKELLGWRPSRDRRAVILDAAA